MQYTQLTNIIMMVRPVRFRSNLQTIHSNTFQKRTEEFHEREVHKMALKEFDMATNLLKKKDIRVLLFQDTIEPDTPDSLFPNNWISFHHQGIIVIYPMEAPNRRWERRDDIVKYFSKHFSVKEIIDLSHFEKKKRYLEGTGSMVFDYTYKTVYMSRSTRSDEGILKLLCQKLGFESVVFSAVDNRGKAIYHTNVLMNIGDAYAIVCEEAIRDKKEKESVIQHLKDSGKEIISISFSQLNMFAGNMLQLINKQGKKLLVLSKSALESLDSSQVEKLQSYNSLLPIDIPIIETHGGGSIRCMMASIYLSPK